MCDCRILRTKIYIKKVLKNTIDLMKSRGPDYSDHYSLTKDKQRVNLLHSRLSIIDIKKRSNQPFVIGNYIIIFNGEIYNFKELRQKLINQKINFSTSSDTEVLLRYFIKYNEKCLDFLKVCGVLQFIINLMENFYSKR